MSRLATQVSLFCLRNLNLVSTFRLESPLLDQTESENPPSSNSSCKLSNPLLAKLGRTIGEATIKLSYNLRNFENLGALLGKLRF